ncbi:unnamed protein product [Adineta steineri]|uniref:Uncharacterized protein n=1 Tax=Adineta steineri TaxID=433720 RepID=A0A813XR00_9BILA|nr:unnamed protein product [Adineta steineri]
MLDKILLSRDNYIELATNTHPYANGKTDFDIMARIVEENSPQLPSDVFFSDIFRSFVDTCLIKNYQDRPKYGKLMEQPFFIHSTEQSVDVANWYRTVTSAASQK